MYKIFGKMAPLVRDMTAGFDLGAGMISKSTTDFLIGRVSYSYRFCSTMQPIYKPRLERWKTRRL